jgi:hypothetical protein
MRVLISLLTCLCFGPLLQACTTTRGAADQTVEQQLLNEGYKKVMLYNSSTKQISGPYYCKDVLFCTTIADARIDRVGAIR